jgi:hypothetical protein
MPDFGPACGFDGKAGMGKRNALLNISGRSHFT